MADDTVETADDQLLAELRAEANAPPARVTDWGVATSTGRVRPRNEDAHGDIAPHFFVVADGMGGHPGGDLAARTAVTAMLSSATQPVDDWSETIRRLNDQVRIATRARGFDKAGAAIVMAAVRGGLVTIAHVGDCRAYRRRGRELHTLTRDHSVREELLASGVDVVSLTGRGAALHALTRHVGAADENSMADVSSLAPLVGDRLLLCSDGVYRQLSDSAMIDALTRPSCTESAATLVQQADDAGGRDNATALVIEFGSHTEASRHV